MQTSDEFAFVRDSETSRDAAAAALADLALLVDYVDAFGRLADGRMKLELVSQTEQVRSLGLLFV